MITVLSLIHLFVTLALIGVVLIQRSEGGGLGIGSSQGMGSFMSGRGTANLLTRTTAILATAFLLLSLLLALLNKGTVIAPSILDAAPPPASSAPATAPVVPTPGAPPPTGGAGSDLPASPTAPPAGAPAGGAPAGGAPAEAPRPGPSVPTN